MASSRGRFGSRTATRARSSPSARRRRASRSRSRRATGTSGAGGGDAAGCHQLALCVAQGGAVDLHGVALVAEAAEERGDEGLVAEEVVPLLEVEVGSDDGGLPAVALLHELEEDVGLLRAEVEIPHLIHHE